MLAEAAEALFGAYPDPVRLIGPGAQLLYCNEAAQRRIACGLGHLCRHRPPAKGLDPSCPVCQVEAVFEYGEHRRWHVAVESSTESGVTDYFEVTLSPVRDSNGETCAVLEVLRDQAATLKLERYLIDEAERREGELGELRDSQAELLYSDRLAAMERLVAGVAHEIHTPLGAIQSSVDLVERSLETLRSASTPDAKSATDDVQRRIEAVGTASRIISEGADRIGQVIRGLRVFYRVDQSPITTVDIHAGLDSTIGLLGYRLGPRVRVVREYGTLPPLTCRADEVNQIFMNLLTNAAQAIPDEGEIRVRTWADESDVWVEISDSGTGIAEDVLPRIFDLGFTTKKKGLGSGLGLAICKRISDRNGLTLVAGNVSGSGARFTLRLPRIPVEEERG